ncbi:choice-of-anchor K domain-containing protein [Rhodocista pekingensis]|uniref:Choice-of-anchor K domain-containing protein n=1 Tax=Rhodocista pekingensis TaxID=201185 RepID=A0ABW2KSZ1_9PROT
MAAKTLGLAAALGLLLATASAHAIPIAGTSGGSFSNVDNCTGFETCRINGTVNGPATQVEWGYGLISGGSTLTAVDRVWNTSTDLDDFIIAELVWTNLATSDFRTPDLFTVDYTLTVNFTQPNGSSDSELFNLRITNPTNPPGDRIAGMTLADLSNLSFSLNGVIISDIKYAVGGAGSFVNNIWKNPEGDTSRLYVTADFTAAQVPEPAALGLVAGALLGAGVLSRRRRQA